MRRLLIALGVVVALSIPVGAWAWRSFGPVEVAVLPPQRGTAIDAIYATGIVEAVDSSRVGSVAAGRIERVLADVGDRVTRGQVLAVLEDRQASKRVEEVQARLALAEKEERRLRPLADRGFASDQAMQKAQADRLQAQAQLDVLKSQVGDLKIVAPFDGTILARNVDPGQSVAANAVVFTVASLTRLRIAADVDERDIPRVRVGSTIAVRADAFADRVFKSHVTRIRDLADTETRTYRVEAPLPADTPLLTGMTVDVNVVLAERPNALLVPATAIQREPARAGGLGAASVWLVERDRLVRRPVGLGAIGPQMVEVTSGLAEDALVVAAPPPATAEGRRALRLP